MPDDLDQSPPVAFLSYSQTSEDYSNRVLDLAIYLRTHGADAKLDQWDLKEGLEANAFMESMVVDGGADKVIILCDKRYKERADTREGGVGVEAQILTPELYKQQDSSKYVVVSMELDDDGEPCRPAFYGSRIYIDLTNRSKASEAYQSILRFIFNKPLLVAPAIGQPPNFETFGRGAISSEKLKIVRATEAVKSVSPSYRIDIEDVIADVDAVMQSFKYSFTDENISDEFTEFLDVSSEFRDSYISFFHALLLNSPCDEVIGVLEEFMERLFFNSVYKDDGSRAVFQSNDRQKFFAVELTIHIVALFLRQKKYQCLKSFLSKSFLVEESGNPTTSNLSALWFSNDALGAINNKLDRKFYDIVGEYLYRRFGSGLISKADLLCAEIILFLSTNTNPSSYKSVWYPRTALYIERSDRLRLMIEARTSGGLRRLVDIVGANDVSELYSRFRDYQGEWQKVNGQFPRSIFGLVNGNQFYGYGEKLV